MKKFARISAIMAVALATSCVVAETGDIVKSPNSSTCQIWSTTAQGGVYGTWTFTEGHSPGTMTGQGSFSGGYNFSLRATVTPLHKVFVQRRNSTDSNSCDYNGKLVGNTVSGTFICTSGTTTGPEQWSAVISDC